VTTRSARVFGGVGLGQAHLVLATLVGLWLTPVLLARVGQHQYGLWLVGLQLLGYLYLLDLGVIGLLPRETAYASGRILGGESPTLLADTVARIRGVIRWQVPAVLLVTVAAWALLPESWEELRAPLTCVLLFFALTFPMRAYHALLQGLQDLVYLGQVQLVAWAAGTIVLIALVFNGVGLAALAAGWLVTQVITVGACWWRIRTRYSRAWTARARRVGWTEARAFFGRSIWISMAQVAQTLLAGSDVLMVGVLLGPAAAVPYACTAKLIQVLANHPQMVMQAAAPALSEMRMSERRDRLAATTSALTRAMLVLSGAIACVVVAANQDFVSWWVGPAQYGGSALTWVLVLAMLARHLNTTTVYAVFCFGYERRLSITAVADGLVTVVTALVLVPHYGLLGVGIASLVGVVTVSYVPNLRVLAREIGVHPGTPILELRGWFVRFALCAAASAALAALPLGHGLPQLVTRATGASLVYALIMFPFAVTGTLGVYVRRLLPATLQAWSARLSRADAA
jgi:O-antigen/teichoic acid export membrane protein